MLIKITGLGKQFKCPTTEEWIKNLWDLYTIKAEKIRAHAVFFFNMDGTREYTGK